MVWPEAGVNKLPKERIVEQRHGERFVVLELVVPVDADGLEVASEGTHEHDKPGHHGRARVVSAQNDNASCPRSICHIEMPPVKPLEEVGLVKLCWGVILTLK